MQETVPAACPTAPPSPPMDSEDHILAKEAYSLDFDMNVFSFSDNKDGDAPKVAAEQPSAVGSSATTPRASPKPAEVLHVGERATQQKFYAHKQPKINL